MFIMMSSDKTITYGSFSASNPDEFTGWDQLNTIQKIELNQYMQNMRVIYNYFGEQGLNEQSDFRLRLPLSFISCINEINIMATNNQIEMDIFKPMVMSLIQQLKVVSKKLPEPDKSKVLELLEKLGLSEQNKMDYSAQIQAVCNSLLTIFKKSEKLELLAKELFNKNKILTPKSIEQMDCGLRDTAPFK